MASISSAFVSWCASLATVGLTVVSSHRRLLSKSGIARLYRQGTCSPVCQGTADPECLAYTAEINCCISEPAKLCPTRYFTAAFAASAFSSTSHLQHPGS